MCAVRARVRPPHAGSASVQGAGVRGENAVCGRRAARAEEDMGMLDQDTAPKELFYTEGGEALRAARLQVTLNLPNPMFLCWQRGSCWTCSLSHSAQGDALLPYLIEFFRSLQSAIRGLRSAALRKIRSALLSP